MMVMMMIQKSINIRDLLFRRYITSALETVWQNSLKFNLLHKYLCTHIKCKYAHTPKGMFVLYNIYIYIYIYIYITHYVYISSVAYSCIPC